jgi:hypothetical protein
LHLFLPFPSFSLCLWELCIYVTKKKNDIV